MTPFLDIWNKLAGNLGIVTERMRQNRMDMAANEELNLRNANEALASAMQGADPEQSAIIAQEMRDRAVQANENIQAINRGTPAQQLPTSTQLVAPFYEQRQALRQNLEAQGIEFTKKLRDEYHAGILSSQAAIDKVNTEADTLLNLASSSGLGSEDKSVQARFRSMLGASAGDLLAGEMRGGGPIGEILSGLLGAGDNHIYSPDEIVKGVSAWRSGQLSSLQAQHDTLVKSALSHGFQLDEGGGLQDLNIPQYQSQKPNIPSAPIVPAPPPNAQPVPGNIPSQQQEHNQIVRNATIGGIAGHYLLHGLVNRVAAALTGASVGRAAGPIGSVVGAIGGAVAPQIIEHATDTLDERIHQVAGPNVYETSEGELVDASGAPISVPRGLAEQVKRRALARRQAIMRPVN